MYGKIYPKSELPEDANFIASDYEYFYSVMLAGVVYCGFNG